MLTVKLTVDENDSACWSSEVILISKFYLIPLAVVLSHIYIVLDTGLVMMTPWPEDMRALDPWEKMTQNGRHFANDTFKRIFLNENVRISNKISPKFVPEGPINNIPALVQIMAWRRPGDKPLSEPMVVSSLTHICVTWPQWVNDLKTRLRYFLS